MNTDNGIEQLNEELIPFKELEALQKKWHENGDKTTDEKMNAAYRKAYLAFNKKK